MRIRFGFVAMSLKLIDASPSKTVTYTRMKELPDDESRLHRMKKIAKSNLVNTFRILAHADAHGIKMYRFSSKLIPLVTHKDVIDWDYSSLFKDEFLKIGRFVKEKNMRVSAHPDHFTVLNSQRDEVVQSSIRDLEYHADIFDAMELGEESKLVMHVGGSYKDKTKALKRFETVFKSLPYRIKSRIILENDDKSYTATEVLELCKSLEMPMVLDVHHHECNSNGEDLSALLPDVFSTWKNQYWPPKIHFSSPKSKTQFRHHADDIDPDSFIRFLRIAKSIDQDFDVMIEAKNKDLALFHLMESLKKSGIQFIGEATILF